MSENRELVALESLNVEKGIIDKIKACQISYYELNTMSIRHILPRLNLSRAEAKELYQALIDVVYSEETIPGVYCKCEEEQATTKASLVTEVNSKFNRVRDFIDSLEGRPTGALRKILLLKDIDNMEALKSLTMQDLLSSNGVGPARADNLWQQIQNLISLNCKPEREELDRLFLPVTLKNKLVKAGVETLEHLTTWGVPAIKIGERQSVYLEEAVNNLKGTLRFTDKKHSVVYLEEEFADIMKWYEFLNSERFTSKSYFKLINNINTHCKRLFGLMEYELKSVTGDILKGVIPAEVKIFSESYDEILKALLDVNDVKVVRSRLEEVLSTVHILIMAFDKYGYEIYR